MDVNKNANLKKSFWATVPVFEISNYAIHETHENSVSREEP